MRATRHACFPVLAVAVAGLTGCSAVRYEANTSKINLPVSNPRPASFARAPALGAKPIAHAPRPPGKPATELQFETSHPKVQRFLDAYQTDLRSHIVRSLERGSKYLPQMASILAEEGVPPELAYLPIIESGYRVNAVSRAGAVGPWQFIRGTGRRYGLRIDGYVDERRDPEKATRAAARYLRDLYDMFEDWQLSLAAYNTGEANIARVRNRWHIDDFWEMSERGHLPAETSQYVPRFIAALEIARAPEEYGLEIEPASPPRYDLIDIDRPLSLRTVANLSGTSLATIKELNPALRRGVVPPKGYAVRVPKGARGAFQDAYARMREATTSIARVVTRITHRVKRGETPGSIAQDYGISVTALMRANRIRNPRSLRVGQLLSIPGGRKPERVRVVASSAKRARSRNLN